ncbi:MAG TPA: hypothetical protein VJC07_02225 [Candidatus Nanoarchaeia archaeon]|nr:hypothetical protein [Candidatus Nanoarchaeia archaeon]
MAIASSTDLDYRTWPLRRYEAMFAKIYGEHNRFLSNEHLLLHIVEESGELAEDLRKEQIVSMKDSRGNSNGLLVNIPDIFAWICALSSRHGSLEDMIWAKFPGMCPYCFASSNCNCIARKPKHSDAERAEILGTARADAGNRPSTLYGFQQMLNNIYGVANRSKTLYEIGYHLSEEVGEVAKALRLHDRSLLLELADVFGWLVGMTHKLSGMTGVEYRLDDMTWERYPARCPHCNEAICTCH